MDLPYEIVRVLNPMHLIDSESYQRTFEPEQIGRLQPGFYVVRWPSGSASRYDARADYMGPYATRQAAEDAHTTSGLAARVAEPDAVDLSAAG